MSRSNGLHGQLLTSYIGGGPNLPPEKPENFQAWTRIATNIRLPNRPGANGDRSTGRGRRSAGVVISTSRSRSALRRRGVLAVPVPSGYPRRPGANGRHVARPPATMAAPVDEFVGKPIRPAGLSAVIERVSRPLRVFSRRIETPMLRFGRIESPQMGCVRRESRTRPATWPSEAGKKKRGPDTWKPRSPSNRQLRGGSRHQKANEGMRAREVVREWPLIEVRGQRHKGWGFTVGRLVMCEFIQKSRIPAQPWVGTVR
jgi:hypothetical protein